MEFNYSLGRLACPNCQIVIRPTYITCSSGHLVCPNCKKHTNNNAKTKNKIKKCRSNAIELPFLDVIFKDAFDFCQYNCGYQGKVLNLKEHECSCQIEIHSDPVNCIMESCNWSDVLENLVDHVSKEHPNSLVVLRETPVEGFSIDFDNPNVLIIQYNVDSPFNELYCLRLCQNSDNRYALIQYAGHIGPEVNVDKTLNEYKIFEINTKDFMIGDIRAIQSCKDFSANSKHILENGIKITTLKGKTYLVQLKNSKLDKTKKEVRETPYCALCSKKVRGNVSQCNNGHNICTKCAKQLEKCPNCSSNISKNSFLFKSNITVVSERTEANKKSTERDGSKECKTEIKEEQFDDFSDNCSVLDFVEVQCEEQNNPDAALTHDANTAEIKILKTAEFNTKNDSQENVRRFICDKCGKIFKNPGNLRVHLRIHSNNRLIHCSQCSKTFNDTSNLKRHLRIHTGEKPFSCHVCGKSFTELGTLTRHLRIHTGVQPYKCHQCGRAFNVAGSLSRHLRIHAGVRPFSCEICSKAFSRSSHLKTHMRVHNRV